MHTHIFRERKKKRKIHYLPQAFIIQFIGVDFQERNIICTYVCIFNMFGIRRILCFEDLI